jgi:hypothetical protein
VPVVGEIIYPIEKYSVERDPMLFTGAAWDSLPCTVIEVREHDAIVMAVVPESFETKDGHGYRSGPIKFKIPRIDESNGERPKDEGEQAAKQWRRRS